MFEYGGQKQMVLFYGDPRHPDGLFPPGELAGASATEGGRAVPITGAYHVIGAWCNSLFRPSDGEMLAVPGSGCDTWKPSAADRAAQRFGRNRDAR